MDIINVLNPCTSDIGATGQNQPGTEVSGLAHNPNSDYQEESNST